jgi:integrase
VVFDGVQKHLRGGRVAANHLWTVLNGLFAYALDHDVRGDNPMLGVKRPAKARSKDRVLDPEQELKWVLLAAKALPFPYGPFVTVLTFTGCRRGEALNMRWRDLNLDDGVWTQPRSKNGRMHTVTLTPTITGMLKTLPRKNECVFFGGYGRGPFTNLAGVKRMLDAKIIELCGEHLEPWSLHDLRRTFATYVVPLGIDEFVVGKCLNHSSKTITGTTYSLWHYYDQKRHAWSVWSDRLVQLTELPSSNVVKLQRA